MASKKTEVCVSRNIQEDLRIVLLGKTGSGKSSTGNTILGREEGFEAEISPTSVTKTCMKIFFQYEDRRVSIIDTPGIFDTSMKEDKLKEEIQKCIVLSVPGPHVFLLVIRLDRFTEEQRNTVKWIEDNFGAEASKYTLVLFTRGDELKQKPIEAFLEESSDLRQLIRTCNARYIVFDNTSMDDRTQVNDLFEKIDEIVQLNGGHYTSSIYEEAQRKMKSDERWKTCVKYAPMLGACLIQAAVVVALPPAVGAVGALFAAEEVAASSLWTTLMAGASGIVQYVWRIPRL